MPYDKSTSPLLAIGLLLSSLIAYIYLGYAVSRTDFYTLMSLFGGLFIAYGIFYRLCDSQEHIKWGIITAIVIRFALLFSIPNLSDDFWRFIWDGHLFANGISPFLYLPSEVIHQQLLSDTLNEGLFLQLNSPNYYSIYPPVNQYIFALSAPFSPPNIGAIISMKAFLFAFECGSLFLMHRLLKRFQLADKKILLYALNPLVIIELSGNLHFEAAMIFFSLLAAYFLLPNKEEQKQNLTITQNTSRLISSATAMAAAICTKLWPLIFLPFLIKRLGWLKSIAYSILAAIITLLLFATVLNWTILQNLFNSIGLYFQKFEFNASIYYIIRAIGYQIKGWNIISLVGKYLALATFLSILFVALKEKSKQIPSFFQSMLFALSIYLAFATIVHPWYITPLIAFSLFTNFRFPILWSLLIPLSYYTYRTDAYTESLLLVGIEYSIVYAFLLYELYSKRIT